MAKSGINMPAGFGGLVRYNEEYKSTFMLSQKHVVIFVVLVVIFVIALKVFFPIK